MSSISVPTLRLPSGAKFWKKRSANISEYDPTFRAIYLGNVLTSWAKGKTVTSIDVDDVVIEKTEAFTSFPLICAFSTSNLETSSFNVGVVHYIELFGVVFVL